MMVFNMKSYKETLKEQLKNNIFRKEYNKLEYEYQIIRENINSLDKYINKEI